MQGAASEDAAGGEAFWSAWRNHDPPPNNPSAGYSGWDTFLNQSYLFANRSGGGETGWAYLLPRARSELYFSLDNQWATHKGGSLGLDTAKRFPDFAGKSPSPLGALVTAVKELGWAGLSVWVPGGATASELSELHTAGVGVLKVDGGDAGCKVTQLAKEHAPELWVEHGFCGPDCPLNGPVSGPGAGRWPMSMAHRAMETLNCSDSFRSCERAPS